MVQRRSSVAVSPALGAILGRLPTGDYAELAPANAGNSNGSDTPFFPDLPLLAKARADLTLESIVPVIRGQITHMHAF
jgi:hypothetical protein